MLRALSPRRRALVLSLGAVVLAVAGTVVVRAVRPSPAPAAVPVFVVPGYGGDADSVPALVAALRARGRDVRVVVPPDSGRAPITDGAASLDAAVRASRAPLVDVVGYSAGGVVVRTWVFDHGAGRARHVVTLGSPHHGTDLLRSLGAATEECTGACADMRPGSALLGRLNAGDETPDGPDWVSIFTANDETVTPPTTARLDGARNVRIQDSCPGRRVSHSDLVTDAVVVGWAAAAASEGAAASFGC
jgi:triacylglycerol lipase